MASSYLKSIYPALQQHHQIDDANVNYMATLDSHGEEEFLEKFGKFDQEKANHYRVMFEAAIEKASQKALKLGEEKGIQLGEKKGIQLGKKEGIKLGEKKGKKEMLRELVKKGIITQEVADQMEKEEK